MPCFFSYRYYSIFCRCSKCIHKRERLLTGDSRHLIRSLLSVGKPALQCEIGLASTALLHSVTNAQRRVNGPAVSPTEAKTQLKRWVVPYSPPALVRAALHRWNSLPAVNENSFLLICCSIGHSMLASRSGKSFSCSGGNREQFWGCTPLLPYPTPSPSFLFYHFFECPLTWLVWCCFSCGKYCSAAYAQQLTDASCSRLTYSKRAKYFVFFGGLVGHLGTHSLSWRPFFENVTVFGVPCFIITSAFPIYNHLTF